MDLAAAASSLRSGGFVLLHDSAGREDEVDMVAAAGSVGPGHIARMRRDGGGLVCLALGHGPASRIGLPYLRDVLAGALGPGAEAVTSGPAPYGDLPSFSVPVNHRSARTGVTDADRAATVREMAALCSGPDPRGRFVSSFRAPGHVPLLVAAPGMLSERRGHTEMSVYLAEEAGLPPAAAICEMMDSETHGALSAAAAAEYARRTGAPFVDGAELAEHAGAAAR